jgi:hypothetical protein
VLLLPREEECILARPYHFQDQLGFFIFDFRQSWKVSYAKNRLNGLVRVSIYWRGIRSRSPEETTSGASQGRDNHSLWLCP